MVETYRSTRIRTFVISIIGLFLYLDKTVKLWKISEKTKRAEGYNLRDENGIVRSSNNITNLRIPVIKPMELMVEATPKRVFSNAHTYHINSISLNSDQETFLSADDLRINLWNAEITNLSFSKLSLFKRDKILSRMLSIIECIDLSMNLDRTLFLYSIISSCLFT
jgi:hypothetical protein